MTNIIEVHGLDWHYMPITADGQPILALNHISLDVRQGEFLAITGPTGAGKSTLCLALTGLIPNSVDGIMNGQVLINAQDTSRVAVADIARHVGYVQQEPREQLFSITVEDDLAFPMENMGMPYDQMDRRIDEALSLVSMSEFRKRKPTALSGGQMQRVAIAAALVNEPDVLILDEPTAALDSAGEAEVFAALETIRDERPITIVIAEQKTDRLAQCADRVIVMDEGRIIEQGGRALFADEPELFLSHGIDLPEACEIAWKLNETAHRSGTADGCHPYRFATAHEALRTLGNGRLTAFGGQPFEPHATAPLHTRSLPTSLSMRPGPMPTGSMPPRLPRPLTPTRSAQALRPEQHKLPNREGQPEQAVNTNRQHPSHRNSTGRQLSSGITISHLCYSYGQSLALNDVNMEITGGMFLALLGRNGSGKTTLAKHLNGLLTPASGTVTVDGLNTGKHPIGALARHVGMVFQNPDDQIFCSSVHDEIAFGPRSIGYDDKQVHRLTDNAMCQFGLQSLRDAPPATLGYGERKKVAIASVLAMNSGIIVLDEPTAGLDRRLADQLLAILADLNAQGVTVIIVSHDIRAVARTCSHAAVLDSGHLLEFGTTREILTDTALLSKAGCAIPFAVQASLALDGEALVAKPYEAALTPDEFAMRFVPAASNQSLPNHPGAPR
ncbi:ABC transporter ATP-binding protein [Bifidobacterium sp.]|uniref:ABC transporter ATP-binding protein n=1 Tax=Bifidobacterium sp. TaxID=41200 RepID=UPI0025C73F24|nr:ABC transporter ATP-binding protein [Bifidobacterium sp.]MCH4208876.1 energy-coupling factor ABC transporter ATP-binding protein [Bifidobacterium sp.]MCI1224423.1 energy-coupling factor ABC transporter ATP-binding protein [Bifidobacterium sp.]